MMLEGNYEFVWVQPHCRNCTQKGFNPTWCGDYNPYEPCECGMKPQKYLPVTVDELAPEQTEIQTGIKG